VVEVRCVLDVHALLGESPVWNAKEQALYWVDIKKHQIHRYFPYGHLDEVFELKEEVGCLAVREEGGIVAGFRTGLYFFNLEIGSAELIIDPEANLLENRFNDGKCDRLGRFWAGTMDDSESMPTGAIYRLDADLRVKRMLAGFVVPNGMGWSPDNHTMYLTDSYNRTIYAFDYDLDLGEVSRQRVFARISEKSGFPDGLTVDAEGFIWSAHWDGWRVTRYTPDGRIDKVIMMPVQRPTSCCFGGEKLDILFVTSASIGLTKEEVARGALAGSLFQIVDTGVKGLPDAQFVG